MSKDQRHVLGKKGEDIAVDFLKNIGFDILKRNYKYGRKEIDIVGKDGKTIVFVEVKTRSSKSFGTALEKVNYKKRKNMVRVARFFLQRRDYSGYDFRFDVVAIDSDSKIEHIKGAFMVEGRE